jgi:hypothetical protein
MGYDVSVAFTFYSCLSVSPPYFVVHSSLLLSIPILCILVPHSPPLTYFLWCAILRSYSQMVSSGLRQQLQLLFALVTHIMGGVWMNEIYLWLCTQICCFRGTNEAGSISVFTKTHSSASYFWFYRISTSLHERLKCAYPFIQQYHV